jgi:hypothetical protein
MKSTTRRRPRDASTDRRDAMLNTVDAAARLGVTEGRVRVLCREGRLGKKVGRNWIITAGDLRRFKRLPIGGCH